MCVILSIINIPLYLVYASAAQSGEGVNILSMNSVVDGYTLGNIGSVRKVCSNTHIPGDAGPKLFPGLSSIVVDPEAVKFFPPSVMKMRCPLKDDYFFQLSEFAFMNKIDYEFDYFTSANSRCEIVNEKNAGILQQTMEEGEETETLSDEQRSGG